jgi:hypothetical protein
MHPWPWDGHYKSILLPADEEIMGSLYCQLKVCAIDLPEVHTLAAMGLLWALEKGYYAAHV